MTTPDWKGLAEIRRRSTVAQRKAEKSAIKLNALFSLIAILAIPLLMAWYGDWAYDDWTCAFKNCRVLK